MKKVLFLLLIIIVLSAFVFSSIAMAAAPERLNEPGYASSDIAPALDRGAEADGEAAAVFADAADPPDFLAYIIEKAYVLIPVLYFIGFLLKKIPGMPDWLIPFILVVIGVLAAMLMIGWTIEGAIQGILVTGVTVLTNQAYKQLFIKRKVESSV